jgi:ferritin-like metal-binding protein YciE
MGGPGLVRQALGYKAEAVYKPSSKGKGLAVIKALSDLFYETLRDMFYAEKKILRTLPKLAKAVNSDDLREAFLHHRDETVGQVERIERVFEIIGKPARGKTCDAIDGIIQEGNEVMADFKGNPALDAGLLAGAQAVEHYEISRYGTLIAWAKEMRLSEAPGLLQETLQQEIKADELLSKIAKKAVNAAAAA